MDYKLIYLARRNATIAPQDWPRAWRSHAVFASQFPVVGAKISSLFYCSRIYEPDMSGALNPEQVSQTHDGVAIVASPSAESLGGDLTPEDRARIDADELRVFSDYTPNFSFRAREVLVEGAAHGPAAVIRFVTRRTGLAAEAFLSHWNGQHAERARRAAAAFGGVTRYVHNELIEPPPGDYRFDAVSETWFDSEEAASQSLSDPGFAAAAADLQALCEPADCVTMLTRVVHRWPKA